MTFQEFDEYQDYLIAQVIRMKDTKGKEYANSQNRFANFNRLSFDKPIVIENTTIHIPNYLIGWIYCKKHLDAIENYCQKDEIYSTESIESRIIDAITYLTLIAGMIKEKESG